MHICSYLAIYVCNLVNVSIFQEGTTPITLAMVAGQSDAVDLLKNKYGQQEPSPEAVSSLNIIFVCSYAYVHMYATYCMSST